MKINFNNDGKRRSKQEVELKRDDFEGMMKTRAKQLPKLQETIQEALKDYSGESVCIIVQKEDENGLPSTCTMMMGGVTRPECQIAMVKALDHANKKALEVLLESAKGDTEAMLALAMMLAKGLDKTHIEEEDA